MMRYVREAHGAAGGLPGEAPPATDIEAGEEDSDSFLCIHPRASKSLNIRRALKNLAGY